MRVRLREETTPLLVRRMRGGLWILLLAVALFAPEGLRLPPAQVLPFYLVKAVQLGTIAGAFVALRLQPTWRGSIAIAVFVAGEVECLRAGCDDFATKPIDAERLIETVQAQLDRASSRSAGGHEPILVSRLAGRPELAPLVQEFVSRLPERVSAMERSLVSGDLSDLIVHAHQLKGSAGGYGFPSLTEAAASLEAGARAQLGMDEVRGRLDRVAGLCRLARAVTPEA